MDNSSGILVHYYLNGEEHLIDAQLRNKCEAQLLAIYREAARVFDVKFEVVSRPSQEGGFKEFWQLLGDNNKPITSVSAIAAAIGIFISFIPSEHDRLTKQLTVLEIEEKQLLIQKLRQELNQSEGQPNEDLVKQAANALKGNNKTVTLRSNFYKNLTTTSDVKKLGVGTLNSNGLLINDELTVLRRDFPRFILKTNKLPPITDDNATIEIIAPVLDEGPYKWKGLYQGSPISFNMADKVFRASVLNETVSFKHGSTILCVLKIHRELDESGEEVTKGYTVSVVLGLGDENNLEQTSQGIDYKQTRKEQKAQTDMFSTYEDWGDFS